MKSGALDSGSVPSLRRRLLLLVSVASLLMLGLASSISYRRARHEVQELMDDQLAKTAQLVLAQAESGDDHFRELPARIAGLRGLSPRRNRLTLEYQIGRPDGTVLTRSPDAPATPINGPLGYATLDDAGTPWRSLLLESADHALRVQIVESIPKRDKEALEIAYKTIKPIALMLPLLLLAIYFSVRRGLKPLDDLASEVSTRSADNMAALATRDVPREAQPLVAAINRLLFRLGQTLENERRFTADAAHELRTPLAAARIQAQVAQLSGSAEQRTHALAQTMAGLDRATRLVEQMLRLARLDPLGRLPDSQPVPLADLARRVVAGVRDTSHAATIELDLAAPDAIVEGDAGLLEIVLRNLIDNAVRYCPADCRIGVFLRTENGAPVIGVSDNGPGVPADELPRLIERFYRGNSVTAEGSGLGLTIVSRIAELHGARLELANRTEGGQIVGFEARLRWEA
ncbi:ATP-binding protein [Propionivibrio limicola]|uniref:ATP-binding protein n=1 Tax=Propionivibrio limicola TaxID=167645 RepID=UPI001B879AEC|nr:ATP-binding protein [Propionivibrio limicola]